MKRGEVLQEMVRVFGNIVVPFDYGENGVNVDAGLMLMIWRYLQEEVEDPAVSPCACQPGRAVGIWEAENDQKDPEDDQKGPGKGRGKVDVGKVIALYKAGWTLPQIADEIGCVQSVVSYHVNKAVEAGEVERRKKVTK